jgi:hypothetical protein
MPQIIYVDSCSDRLEYLRSVLGDRNFTCAYATAEGRVALFSTLTPSEREWRLQCVRECLESPDCGRTVTVIDLLFYLRLLGNNSYQIPEDIAGNVLYCFYERFGSLTADQLSELVQYSHAFQKLLQVLSRSFYDPGAVLETVPRLMLMAHCRGALDYTNITRDDSRSMLKERLVLEHTRQEMLLNLGKRKPPQKPNTQLSRALDEFKQLQQQMEQEEQAASGTEAVLKGRLNTVQKLRQKRD